MPKFQVYYYRHTLEMVEDKDSWRKAVQFVNFLDSYGGFAHRIVTDDKKYYLRHIDEENGSDYWTDPNGNVVNLEQIEHRD